MTWRGLYLITPDDNDTVRWLERVAAVLPCRPALVQYRNKRAVGPQQRDQARALKALCHAVDVPLIINDDWRLALDVGADGAHLGEADGDFAEARRMAPDLWLGASCYDSIARARVVVAEGADYIAFGAFFPTRTKTTTRRADPALLEQSAVLGVPRVAIGGITPDNAGALLAAGADLLAVVGAVFDAPDPLAAAQRFTTLFAAPRPGLAPGRAAMTGADGASVHELR